MTDDYPDRMMVIHPAGNRPVSTSMPNDPIFELQVQSRGYTVEVSPRGTYWGREHEAHVEIGNPQDDYYNVVLSSWGAIDELKEALEKAGAIAFGPKGGRNEG